MIVDVHAQNLNDFLKDNEIFCQISLIITILHLIYRDLIC